MFDQASLISIASNSLPIWKMKGQAVREKAFLLLPEFKFLFIRHACSPCRCSTPSFCETLLILARPSGGLPSELFAVDRPRSCLSSHFSAAALPEQYCKVEDKFCYLLKHACWHLRYMGMVGLHMICCVTALYLRRHVAEDRVSQIAKPHSRASGIDGSGGSSRSVFL